MARHDEAPWWTGVAGRLRRFDQMRRDVRRVGVAPVGPREPSAPAPGGARTTVDATIRPIGAGRYRRLDWAPGEAHSVRTDVGGDPAPDRADRRRSVLYFAHHTDTHVCDAQGPARLESGEIYGWVNPGADSGHRPQETCTTQVLDRLVAATNALATSPLSGARMAWCLQTGDNTDNRAAAEVLWFIDVLDGRRVGPNTGAAGRYEGVQRSGWKAVWHPDRMAWDRRSKAGYPYLPGFLDAAVSPFDPVGLQVPWLAVFGNHDAIFQGTFGPSDRVGLGKLGAMLTGSGRKPIGPGLAQALALARRGADTETWERRARGPGILDVTPDGAARRPLSVEEYLAALLAPGPADAPGPGPVGHGYAAADRDARRTWWTRREGDVQIIGLDSCNHDNGDGGGVGPGQLEWLEEQLITCHSRWQGRNGRWYEGGDDRLVILASHHNTWTMTNATPDDHDPGPRALGAEVIELLDRFPNVVAWVNGHSHEHKVVGHRRTDGGGWWEINTGSGIDFGQQGRTVELFDNGDGTLSIVATVFDHDSPPRVAYRRDADWSPTELASLSRELAANDDRWLDPMTMLGGTDDRNVELVLPAPFALR